MNPEILSALITGGTQLAGGGISAIGAGMSSAQAREDEKKRLEMEQANKDREFGLQKQGMGMQGIQLLMALQSQAQQQFKGQRFRDALYKAAGG